MANTVEYGTIDERPAPGDADAFVVIAPASLAGLYLSDGSAWALQGGGGGSQTLAEVLAEGADAEGTGIDNLGATTLAGNLDAGGNSIDNIDQATVATLNVSEIAGDGSNWDAGGARIGGVDPPNSDDDAVNRGWANARVGGVVVADQTHGSFWTVSGSGLVNNTDPVAFIDPVTATPAQIAQALIDAGFMASS